MHTQTLFTMNTLYCPLVLSSGIQYLMQVMLILRRNSQSNDYTGMKQQQNMQPTICYKQEDWSVNVSCDYQQE